MYSARSVQFAKCLNCLFAFLFSSYILFTLRPDNSTVLSCLKLLIRLARSGEAVAETLFTDDLLRNVFTTFLPHLGSAASSSSTVGRFYGRPQYQAVKLVRLVAAYGREWCDRMLQWGLWEVLKSYVFVRYDIKVREVVNGLMVTTQNEL